MKKRRRRCGRCQRWGLSFGVSRGCVAGSRCSCGGHRGAAPAGDLVVVPQRIVDEKRAVGADRGSLLACQRVRHHYDDSVGFPPPSRPQPMPSAPAPILGVVSDAAATRPTADEAVTPLSGGVAAAYLMNVMALQNVGFNARRLAADAIAAQHGDQRAYKRLLQGVPRLRRVPQQRNMRRGVAPRLPAGRRRTARRGRARSPDREQPRDPDADAASAAAVEVCR
jgi:hypothetical protein